jgi:putative pyruvate formate lyase activating enzyme
VIRYLLRVMYRPAYVALHEQGQLHNRIKALREILTSCRLCPRVCEVNRLEGEQGYCRAGAEPMISSAFPHFGEEPPLVGTHGSGTIFLTHCNLRCVFCQNYDISHLGAGRAVSTAELAHSMIELQRAGCHNINFVTPTHYVPQIIAALPEAIESGLMIPLVYNCGGYESLEVTKLLDGIIDIYMPDVKFAREEDAAGGGGYQGVHRLYCSKVVTRLVREYHGSVPSPLPGRGISGDRPSHFHSGIP